MRLTCACACLFAVTVMTVLTIGVVSCKESPREESPAGKILQGEHQLRKMMELIGSESRASGGFFLFVGSYSSETKQSVSVKFAWRMNDGTYAISSLPIEKIRVRLVKDIRTPTIKFRWSQGYGNEIQDWMDNHVVYAVITCKEEHWPTEVQLPLSR